MGDPRGFLRYRRETPARRPIDERVQDWREVYLEFPADKRTTQAARCMDCGIPFCHEGCPLGNLIPEWNDLTFRGRMDDAAARLHATNNFPELTGRLCPAPCEGSCVLGINAEPVAIKQIEFEIAEWARGGGLVPVVASRRTHKRVAVIGSGPAGLAAAQQLTRAGHEVTVFERAERPGGLLRYGVPEFKLEKHVIDDRLEQMRAEGTRFESRVAIGLGSCLEVAGSAAPDVREVSAAAIRQQYDAVVVATGSTRPRDLRVPGRELSGVHFAMEYLRGENLVLEGYLPAPPVSAAGKHVVIIGGGDTGADCLGTVHRQGAAGVVQLEILEEPPASRAANNPWPTWPVILRTSSAHEEGGERLYALSTTELCGSNGAVAELVAGRVRPVVVEGRMSFEPTGEEPIRLQAELVLLALGFEGPERDGLVRELGLELSPRGTVAVDRNYMTSETGVFAAGDAVRGQSLVVWAIAEGRSVAAAVDAYLMGQSDLPAPLRPGTLALA